MRDPRPLPEAPDPRREPEGGSGGLRLGGASGPPAAGTRTCIRSPRASAEPLILRALPRLATRPPHLLVSWRVATARGFSCCPADPEPSGRERAWDGGPGQPAVGGAGGSGPAGKLREGGAARGARLCLSPIWSSANPGSPRHFRGWGGVSDRLLRGRRLPSPPPPVLAAHLVSGEGRSPREAPEERGRKSPETQRFPSAGVELQARAAEGKEGC